MTIIAQRMTAKYGGVCVICGAPIQPGDDIVYHTVLKKAAHAECAEKHPPHTWLELMLNVAQDLVEFALRIPCLLLQEKERLEEYKFQLANSKKVLEQKGQALAPEHVQRARDRLELLVDHTISIIKEHAPHCNFEFPELIKLALTRRSFPPLVPGPSQRGMDSA